MKEIVGNEFDLSLLSKEQATTFIKTVCRQYKNVSDLDISYIGKPQPNDYKSNGASLVIVFFNTNDTIIVFPTGIEYYHNGMREAIFTKNSKVFDLLKGWNIM